MAAGSRVIENLDDDIESALQSWDPTPLIIESFWCLWNKMRRSWLRTLAVSMISLGCILFRLFSASRTICAVSSLDSAASAMISLKTPSKSTSNFSRH